MEGKVGILTFELFHGKKRGWAGSSRIRGEWVAKYWKEAEIFKMGEKYDTVIYQKAYWIDHAKAFKGTKILDLCDPDWMQWQYKVKEMIEECDAVTTSTEALADAVRTFTDKPVLCIPDRMDMDFHQGRKFHQGRAKWAVWYGYSSNFPMIKPVLHYLKKFQLNLIVVADMEFQMPSTFADSIELQNIPWKLETINQSIMKGDLVINPHGTKGKWRFKSNNKTLSAWALGMPVATTVEEMERFLDGEERQKESKLRLDEVKEKWDVKQSVEDYKNLIESIKQK